MNSASLSLQFRYRFEAAHRLTSSAAPSCRTPHGHTWYATALFAQKSGGLGNLDAADMLAEFGIIKSGWKLFLQETVDHSYFHHFADPIVPPILADTPGARLLPFPGDPTTEMIAGLFALKLRAMHEAQAQKQDLPIRVAAVKIQETPTNSVILKLPEDGSLPAYLNPFRPGLNQTFDGWWNSSAVDRRQIRKL